METDEMYSTRETCVKKGRGGHLYSLQSTLLKLISHIWLESSQIWLDPQVKYDFTWS